MVNIQKASPRGVVSLHYFIYFAILGVSLPYFNLYCHHLGFNGVQIGALSSMRSILIVVFAISWSGIADKYQIRNPIFMGCCCMGTLFWTQYFFHENFFMVLIITGIYTLFNAPVISFLEAMTLEVLGKEKSSYGSIRVWGSIAFIGMVLCTGYLIDIFSIRVILMTVLLGSILQTVLSMRLPSVQKNRKRTRGFRLSSRLFFRKRTGVFLVCAFLMLMGHGTYYGFFSIHLENLGYDNTFIGVAWALASIAEIGVMVRSRWIFKRISYENVLIFSFAVATLRWFFSGVAMSPYFILLLQLTHCVTYGLFHMASVLYIDALSPDGTKTFGQAVNNATTYGLGLMAGFFVSGYLYEHTNAVVMFFVSGLISMVAGLVFAVAITGFGRRHDRGTHD
jgi:MFS transporter, PPP family, 3-phenylpropionic acid transporter